MWFYDKFHEKSSVLSINLVTLDNACISLLTFLQSCSMWYQNDKDLKINLVYSDALIFGQSVSERLFIN